MKRWWFLAIALLSLHCDPPTEPAPRVPPRPLSKDEVAIVEADNAFGLKLFRRLDETAESGKNLFISPLSVSMALGMTLNGAAGATHDSMAATLELAGLTEDQINMSYRSLMDLLLTIDRKVELKIANSVWSRKEMNVERGFVDRVSRFFSAQVTSLDFNAPGAPGTINQWVSNATAGRIPTILSGPIPGDMVMYLINAIYFKGAWSRKFDKAHTAERTFTLADGSTRRVPMMAGDEVSLSVAGGIDYQIVDLPYGDSSYSMTIVLPRGSATLDQLVGRLDAETWNEWIGSLRVSKVSVVMPKFKLDYETSLNDVLKAMGMANAFQSGVADFTRLGGGVPGDLYISEVKHKTFVEVNEEGTEAAAVTSVGIGTVSAPMPITVDRPFLFAIRERHSGAIIFIGRIMNPAG